MALTIKLNFVLKQVLPDTDFSHVDLSTEKNRRALALQKADELLYNPENNDNERAWYFVGYMLDDDGHPYKSPNGHRVNDLERWTDFLATLLYHLLNNKTFNLAWLDDELTDGDYSINNDRLIQWLVETPHRHLAAYVARLMYTQQMAWAREYDAPVQDYVAIECQHFDAGNKANDYIQTVISTLIKVHEHLLEGQALGLDDTAQALTDMLWGYIPHLYPDNYVAMAQELSAYVEHTVPPLARLGSEMGCEEYEQRIMDKCAELATKYDVELDLDTINMPANYLHFWLEEQLFCPIYAMQS